MINKIKQFFKKLDLILDLVINTIKAIQETIRDFKEVLSVIKKHYKK